MICETEKVTDICLEEAIAEETERRRLRRKPFLRRATMCIAGDQPSELPAFCRDISRGGIGLLHEVPLVTGCQFTLSIPLLGRSLEVDCATKWCSPVGEGMYFSGNRYRHSSTPLALLLLSAVLGEELNRRVQRRYPLFRPITMVDKQGDKQAAFCRDVSRGGIGLIHRNPIALGRFVLTIPSSVGIDVVASADIRRCEPSGHGWYTSGGRFPIE